MSLRIDIGWLLATMLVSVRVAAATMLTPILGPAQIPAMVRVLLALVLGAMLVAALPVQPVEIYSTTDLMLATFGELVIGASLSFGFMAAYAATQLAGRVLDVQ